MARLFVPNLDFEIELAGRPGDRGTDVAWRRTTADLSWCFAAIADDGDAVLVDEMPDPEDLRAIEGGVVPRLTPVLDPSTLNNVTEVVPWGWTRSVRELAERLGVVSVAPPADVIETANRRGWGFAIEQDLDLGLPGSRAVETPTELNRCIKQLGDEPRGWVIKADLAMAGRERRRGRGAELVNDTRDWARGLLGRDGVLFVEPWVEPVREVGLQWTVQPVTGTVELAGVTDLLCTAGGGYRGSRLNAAAEGEDGKGWNEVVVAGREAAGRLAALGYHGPVGIDAMQFLGRDGTPRWRPLQDINARYTMGRLALGWRDRIGAHQWACWLQMRWDDTDGIDKHYEVADDDLHGVRIVRTTPLPSKRSAAAGMVLVTASTSERLSSAEFFVSGVDGLR